MGKHKSLSLIRGRRQKRFDLEHLIICSFFNSNLEPFKVNLTAACNFNCLCTETDMEPVCGNNGLTYFSPCHAGCAAFSSRSNFTNCACEYF